MMPLNENRPRQDRADGGDHVGGLLGFTDVREGE